VGAASQPIGDYNFPPPLRLDLNVMSLRPPPPPPPPDVLEKKKKREKEGGEERRRTQRAVSLACPFILFEHSGWASSQFTGGGGRRKGEGERGGELDDLGVDRGSLTPICFDGYFLVLAFRREEGSAEGKGKEGGGR